MSKLKIPFGLRDGQLLAATNVPNGLACGCSCPGCGARLIAKRPKKKAAHFAHHSSDACSSGYETALHLAAKQVLRQRREIVVPAIGAEQTRSDEGTGYSARASRSIPAKLVALDSVEEESRDFGGIIPDIVASYKGKLLLIEIAVTHFVDEIKLEKLRKIGIPAFEIDLSQGPELPTIEDIEKLVINDLTNRTWLLNPRQQTLQQQVEAEAQQKLEELVAAKTRSKLLMWSEHRNYMKLNDAEKLSLEIAATGLTYDDISPYIGKTVRGARSFGVKPNVWQAAVFRKFICPELTWCFDVNEVCDWLMRHLRKP